jgi:hypothetical protein
MSWRLRFQSSLTGNSPSQQTLNALSEAELREELLATISRPDFVEDIIYRAKQMR